MSPVLLLFLLLLLTCGTFLPASSLSLDKISWRPEELGVHHLSIPGELPVPATPKSSPRLESVLLHVFITAHHVEHGPGNTTTSVRGYFFAESISKYRFTPWGQPAQSWAVYKWRYPVVLRDLNSGLYHDVKINTAIWAHGEGDRLHYPMLFEATVPGKLRCIEVQVKQWLHSGQLCFQDSPGPLDLWAQEKPEQHIVWAVMTPWRGDNSDTFLTALMHYNLYHLQVGFAGTIVYVSPYLERKLLSFPLVHEWVGSGKMLLLRWDRFSKFQPVVQKQTYYEVPDQMIIINHALLMFSFQPKAVLFMADIDEYFVPNGIAKTVEDSLTLPNCSLVVKDYPEGLPWGAMNIPRRNFHSSMVINAADPLAAPSEAILWRAPPLLECSPLQSYQEAHPVKVQSKPLLRPAGGVIAWHVHNGIMAPDVAPYKMKENCAFVLHVVNMWKGRLPPGSFTIKRGKWRSHLLPEWNSSDYQSKCISPIQGT